MWPTRSMSPVTCPVATVWRPRGRQPGNRPARPDFSVPAPIGHNARYYGYVGRATPSSCARRLANCPGAGWTPDGHGTPGRESKRGRGGGRPRPHPGPRAAGGGTGAPGIAGRDCRIRCPRLPGARRIGRESGDLHRHRPGTHVAASPPIQNPSRCPAGAGQGTPATTHRCRRRAARLDHAGWRPTGPLTAPAAPSDRPGRAVPRGAVHGRVAGAKDRSPSPGNRRGPSRGTGLAGPGPLVRASGRRRRRPPTAALPPTAARIP